MSALIRLKNGTLEKHTLTLALAMVARGEATMVNAAAHLKRKHRGDQPQGDGKGKQKWTPQA